MTRRWRQRVAAAMAGGLALTGLTVAVAQPSAAASITCSGTSEARQPVLLVHGYNSGPDTWSPHTQAMFADVNGGRSCVAVFDYKVYSTRWVTNPHIGAALAAEIGTLAAASRAGGGTGKVIVVAHSMGGLAVRCAAAASCNGGRRGLAGQLRELISFDTPNLGSFLRASTAIDRVGGVGGSAFSAACYATGTAFIPGPLKAICAEIRAFTTSAATKAFTPGSTQLRTLPNLPSSVPVYALAGHVEEISTFFGFNRADLGDVGDLVVDEASAQAAARTVGGLGGRKTIDCGQIDVSMFFQGLKCDHIHETNNPQFLAAAAAEIARAEQADAAANPKPLRVETIEGTNNSGTYRMTLWAKDDQRNCAAHAYGQVAAFFGQHPCRAMTRYLWTLPFNGREAVVSIVIVLNEIGPLQPINGVSYTYEYAEQLTKLENSPGTGSVNDLLREGHRIPGVGSSIPVGEVFQVLGEDSGVDVFDAWYATGTTASNDPALRQLEQNLFLSEAAQLDFQ